MKKLVSAATRVCFGLVCLSTSIWLVAFTLGLIPDREAAIISGRAALCENVALHCSLLASRGDIRTINTALEGLVERNPDVQSAAIRRPDGSLLAQVGNHEGNWNLVAGHKSTPAQMRVPVMAGAADWGSIEVRFHDSIAPPGLLGWSLPPLTLLFLFVSSASYLLYFFYLRSMLQHLDPSRVIPRRVRQTLDTLAGGLLVLDQQERILLANQSFATGVVSSVDDLVGRKASDLNWSEDSLRLKVEGYPWMRTISEGNPQLDELLILTDEGQRRRFMKCSVTPVYGDDGQQRGALASFDDVTNLEENRLDLRKMLDAMSQARDEIQRQNLELERLAAHDPLTQCFNRRAFFVELEKHWSHAKRHQLPLACLMVDLDHFKSINDNHGHQTGDLVLQKTAELLRQNRRPSDLVCRYGGEEFCLLLPHTDLAGACIVAEQIRAAIADARFDNLSVTASIGVSERTLGARDPKELIDQADKCLYVAKREGRNRFVRFDQAAEQIATFELAVKPTQHESDNSTSNDEYESSIPFHAVTALVSALACRDPDTADHSRRVADLCVTTARRLLPVAESYQLEIAALLHDIGKIGVPDYILLKPDKLTPEERQIMDSHERFGAEIVRSTFSNEKLSNTILLYRAWYGGTPRQPEFPAGEDIPLPARMLAIADAYDSMTKRSSYRLPLTREQAFAELRRCAVRQFDPDLVERFIDSVLDSGGSNVHHANTSQAAALSFGTQIHRLAEALDKQDTKGIATLAHRLNQTATRFEVDEIATVAARLEQTARGQEDTKHLVELTLELIDLCRATQRACLTPGNESSEFLSPPRPLPTESNTAGSAH